VIRIRSKNENFISILAWIIGIISFIIRPFVFIVEVISVMALGASNIERHLHLQVRAPRFWTSSHGPLRIAFIFTMIASISAVQSETSSHWKLLERLAFASTIIAGTSLITGFRRIRHENRASAAIDS
jgi:hypothetical protein